MKNQPAARVMVVAASMSLVLAACATDGANDEQSNTGNGGEYQISIQGYTAETADIMAPVREFADALERESDGRISVDTYWAGSLVPYVESLEGAGAGVADITMAAPIFHPQAIDKSHWAVAFSNYSVEPFLWSPTIAGIGATMKMLKHEAFVEEYHDANVVPIAGWITLPYNLQCDREIDSLQDLRGLNARSGGSSYVGEIEALGMSPISIPSSESYEGMQRGLMNCNSLPAHLADTWSVFEVAESNIWTTMSPATNYYVMNKDSFDSLPTDLQELILDLGAQLTIDKQMAELEEGVEAAKEDGNVAAVQNVVLPEVDSILREHQLSEIERALDNPPAGMSDEDAQGVAEAYFEDVSLYTQTLQELGWDTSAYSGDIFERIAADGENLDVVQDFLESIRADLRQ